MAATTVSFQFRAWLIGTGDAPWDAILRWYRDMAADFLDEMPDLHVEHVGRGVFRGTFRRNTASTVNPRWSIEAFVDPDDDGNWPLVCGRASYLVRGELHSIDGRPVV